MFCISVSFKKTPLPIRQQFAFSEEEQFIFLSELMKQKTITGGVIVSTCNRSEIYFSGDMRQTEIIESRLAAFKQLERECIKKYSLYYQGKSAVRHLFKVACGMDSMVLGEDEILRQVKESYLFSNSQGLTDSELNIIFQGAFYCAKRSKSKTKLSSTPVSIGTLTANRIEEYLREQGMGVEEASDGSRNKPRAKVLVIGATGKIGSIVVKDLLAKGISVIGTSRKRYRSEEIRIRDDERLEWVDFRERYGTISEAAVVVSATTSPHYTVTRDEFLAHIKKGNKYLLIDLAVPFDIDREIGKLEGTVLYDIDYFKGLSLENHNIRIGEVEKAERIIYECAEDVLKKLYIREFQEKMMGQDEEKWFRKMIYYLRDILDSDQFFEVLDQIYQKEGSKGRK